jgi:hypothetical protein
MAGTDPRVVSMSEIKSKLLRPALTSHYICDFQPPTTRFIQDRVEAQSSAKRYDRLSLACVEASLPGSSLMTNEINDDRTGVTERHAYRRQYDDRADFTFYVDAEEYYVIRLFESWIGYAVNEQYGSNPGDLTYNYRANFPDDYSTGGSNGGSLSITKFERDHETTKRSFVYNFVKAFPISINSMPVSYDGSDLLKCNVSFTYSRYWINNLVQDTNSLQQAFEKNLSNATNSNIPGTVDLGLTGAGTARENNAFTNATNAAYNIS